MKKIKIEYYERAEQLVTIRIVPAFMQDGYRAITKRENEKETGGDVIFATEEEAVKRYVTLINKYIDTGYRGAHNMTLTITND